MNFRQRISAVLRGLEPDQVPLAPYDNLVPRGDFERRMRNRGMGLLARRQGVWRERPHIRQEITVEGDVTTTVYHTPAGCLTVRRRRLSSRQYGEGRSVEIEGMIKSVADVDPAIAMIEDTIYHADPAPYVDTTRDLGTDGLVRIAGPSPAYDVMCGMFGVSTAEGISAWAYMSQDHPDHIASLLDACAKDGRKFLTMIGDAPGEFVALGSLNGFYGPATFRKYVLPFYQEAGAYLHARGKICSIHAHAPGLKKHLALLNETGVDVVEAFTPPPFSDLTIAEAREAWGAEKVIWVNFPETVFHHGATATREYAANILRSDRSGRLVIGFTESGLACVVSDEVEQAFKVGFEAVMDAIEEHGTFATAGSR